jgi:cyclopropane fatty-acyl-phospholipid synthase-like methyltransferase
LTVSTRFLSSTEDVEQRISDDDSIKTNDPRCRSCGAPLQYTFADLGVQPFCESYLQQSQLNKMESFYPLHVYVCENCFLVQLEDAISPKNLFTEYAYFSSHSKGWLKHSESYAEMIINKLGLNHSSQIIEIGSNDGYLLQYFAQRNVPVLGIEPATNVAEEAKKKGIPTIVKFFGKETSDELVRENKHADLLIGNNVIAQVPDINDFVDALKNLLKPSGITTLEFHHLMKLMNNNQFDTISHERFSYFSLSVIEKIFASRGLRIFDVEEIPTHGGSLRIYACHSENLSVHVNPRLKQMRDYEEANGLAEIQTYLSFAEKVKKTKRNILEVLIKVKNKSKSIVGYGAHAEANTFLNYCGIGSDFLDYTVDRNPTKQGKFLAGTHIPIFHPDKITETKPDYILVLPWNIKMEIMKQMSFIDKWNGMFIVSIPRVTLYNADGNENFDENFIQEVT